MNLKNINKFRSLIILLIQVSLIGITVSCDNGSDAKVKISGTIEGWSDKPIVLEVLMPNKVEVLLTEKTDEKGNFEFALDSAPNVFLRLKLNENNFVYLFVRENQDLSITGDFPGLAKSYNVNGSEDCALLKQMNQRLIESSDKLNYLKDEINQAALNPNVNTDSLWEKTNETARLLYDSDKAYLTEFIKTNHKSPVIYMALYQYIGTSPILMIENDPEIFEYVLAELKENNPDLLHIVLLESNINTQKLKLQQINRDYINLAVGSEAMDFSLPDINSNNIQLSDFTGQRIVLGFWSSWNKLSVENLRYLNDLKKRYNLTIILVALDTNKEKWKNAISNNKIDNFTNVCDFKSWESPITKIYGVNSVPSYVLISPDSEIEFLTDDIFLLQDKIKELQ